MPHGQRTLALVAALCLSTTSGFTPHAPAPHAGWARGMVARGGGRGGVVGRAAVGLRMGILEDMRNANAERLAVHEEKNLIGKKYGKTKVQAFPHRILNTDWKRDKLAGMLEENGVLGVEKVLSDDTAAELLAYINAESDKSKREVESGEVEFDDRFGGVNCRGKGLFGLRQDQFLPMSDALVQRACAEAMGNMYPLLEKVVGADATLHEVSSLVADPGAPRQCMHVDTIMLPCPQYPQVTMAPLYTFFIALQDVEHNMGHTTFLPRTQTPDAHLLWNLGQKQKENLIASLPAVESGLKTGDTVIFDSRNLHAGGANTSQKRRVLFYFTLSSQHEWPLPNGLHASNSIRKEDFRRWRLADIVKLGAEAA